MFGIAGVHKGEGTNATILEILSSKNFRFTTNFTTNR